MRQQISWNDVTKQVKPTQAIKSAIKNSFYIKEQRLVNLDFVEPDDDQEVNKETARFLVDYLKNHKENPTFMEEGKNSEKTQEMLLMEKIPLPNFAK